MSAVDRTVNVLVQEFGLLRLRRSIGLALAARIPELVANRVRTTIIRLAGVDIGPETVVGGPIRVAGPRAEELRIGAGCWINAHCYFDVSAPVRIGDRVALAQHVRIITNSHEMGDRRLRAAALLAAPVTVNDGCWIGAGALILPGVTIGEGAVVAAGSVVTTDVAEDTIVGGVPARVIRGLGDEPR